MANKKPSKSLIKEVVTEAVGEDAVDVVLYLLNHHDISEFKIAEDTNLEIHVIRNILYRLNQHNLVTYRRKKDKKKGWYISYWTFNEKRVKELQRNLKQKKLDRFKERLKEEEKNRGNYFMCPNACVRMDFFTASENEFRCPECGSLLNQQDNEKTIERLKKNIEQLEKEL